MIIKNFLSRPKVMAVLLVFGVLATGCQPAIRPRDSLSNNASQADNLNTAIAELRRSGDNDIDVTRGFHYLNQWAEQGGTKVKGWQRSTMIDALPIDLLRMSEDFELDRHDFPMTDYRHINEAILTRETTRWVAQQGVPPEFQPWLEEVRKQRGVDIEEQLRASLNLFDWVVRNIRLEPLLPPPPPPVATAGASKLSQRASFRGIEGPGYNRVPWQTLLYSRGDAWQRGWLFLLLARQAGIEGVMLGFGPENNVGDPLPWCPALLIDGELYLFDAELGLPLGNETGSGVATWKEVQAKPNLLRRYDLPGLADYRVKAADLKRVEALLAVSPEALSSRMLALEQSLKGEQHLKLTVSTQQMQETLQKINGIRRVRLWNIPWDAIAYVFTSHQVRQANPQAQTEYQTRYGIYNFWSPMMQGRQRHLRGVFDTVDQSVGARQLYLRSRASNRDLSLAAMDSKQQAAVMTHAKEDATYYLALTHYEQGEYELAAEWFHDRIIEGAPDSPWVSAARYNLGRCYEAQGKFELARDQYLIDSESPQRNGNILRAGLLKERMKEATATP